MGIVAMLRREWALRGGRQGARRSKRGRRFYRVCFELLEDRTAPSATSPATEQLLQSYGQIPLSFEANQGQTASQVNFLSRGSGYALFLTSSEAVLSLQQAAPSTTSNSVARPESSMGVLGDMQGISTPFEDSECV